MTTKAMRLLSTEGTLFVMMVEGIRNAQEEVKMTDGKADGKTNDWPTDG